MLINYFIVCVFHFCFIVTLIILFNLSLLIDPLNFSFHLILVSTCVLFFAYNFHFILTTYRFISSSFNPFILITFILYTIKLYMYPYINYYHTQKEIIIFQFFLFVCIFPIHSVIIYRHIHKNKYI